MSGSNRGYGRSLRLQQMLLFWRRALIPLSTCLIIISLSVFNTLEVHAQGGSAYDLIAAVNQLRASNGLPPYQVNGALMAAAQAHSEYQASIGSITHTGQGGSDIKSRAIAAGYGGGANVFVLENIAGGASMTPQRAVQMWQGDSLHLNTMLSQNAQDVGVGVATSGNMVFYTLAAGYVSAGPVTTWEDTPAEDKATSTPGNPAPAATSIAFSPYEIATPGPDGAVVHTVQQGQALWNIAAIYEIPLQNLLELNSLSENALIRPGDQLVIKHAQVTATVVVTTTSVTTATLVARVQAKISPTSTIPPAALTAPTQVKEQEPIITAPSPVQATVTPQAASDPLIILIAILIFGGTALVIAGNLIKRGL